MSSEDLLALAPPPADVRVSYDSDASQYGELRLPRTGSPFPIVMNIHGGFWRAQYDLAHGGHLCAALAARGLATWNVEYRRVGNHGAGWEGTFADVRAALRFLRRRAQEYELDASTVVALGHSAGGQLALALAAHEPGLKGVVSLAGVVDLREACNLHLSHDAVMAFLGGRPSDAPEKYRQADPMQLIINRDVSQWVIHGSADDVVPSNFSRRYAEQKKKAGEDANYLEIPNAGHFDLIDPRSKAWSVVESTVLHLATRPRT